MRLGPTSGPDGSAPSASPALLPRFSPARVQVSTDADDTIRIRSLEPLADHPVSVVDRLRHWSDRTPDAPFIGSRDSSGEWEVLSYREAADRVVSIAAGLLVFDLSAERPIVLLSGNSIDHALLGFAAQYAGIPSVALSAAYSLKARSHAKLASLIDRFTPGLVFASDWRRFADAVQSTVPPGCPVLVSRRASGGRLPRDPARRIVAMEDLGASTAGELAAVEQRHARVRPGDIAKFVLTSGSTDAAVPKAVICTHGMLAANQQMIRQVYGFAADDPPVMLDWLPWSHTFGSNHNLGMALYNGGSYFIDDGDPSDAGIEVTVRNLAEIRPSVYLNVPAGHDRLATRLAEDVGFGESFFSRLRFVFSAGASLSPVVRATLDHASRRFRGTPLPFATGLGMTESGPASVFTRELYPLPGEVGLPGPGVEVKLVVSQGQREIRYRTPALASGYWRSPGAAGLSLDEEGYLRSGDAVDLVDESEPARGLRFAGRIGGNFKLSTGTWVFTSVLQEGLAKASSRFTEHVVVIGSDRDDVGALVFLNAAGRRALAGSPLDRPRGDEAVSSDEVVAYYRGVLDELETRSGPAASRHVARVLLVTDVLSAELGQLTEKGTVVARAVRDAYGEHAQALYASAGAGVVILPTPAPSPTGPKEHAGRSATRSVEAAG